MTDTLPKSLYEKVKTAKHIVFSDFDGTITLQDTNDYLTDNYGMGYNERKKLNDLILVEKLSFRSGFKQMLNSIKDKSFDECIEILKENIGLDKGFVDFYNYCSENNILIIIVSSGMKPIIETLLNNLLFKDTEENPIDIISNGVIIDPTNPKNWDIIYRDDSDFGHDKSIEIRKIISYKRTVNPNFKTFYCGDGVSDLSAAKETDLLFAKNGKDLIKYCEAEKIKYIKFNDFHDIKKEVIKLTG